MALRTSIKARSRRISQFHHGLTFRVTCDTLRCTMSANVLRTAAEIRTSRGPSYEYHTFRGGITQKQAAVDVRPHAAGAQYPGRNLRRLGARRHGRNDLQLRHL